MRNKVAQEKSALKAIKCKIIQCINRIENKI